MVPGTSRAVAMSCLLLALATSTLEGKELEDYKWIEVSTKHFQVRSTLSEKKTIKLIRNLDLLRLTVPILTNIERTESTIPTHIFVMKRASDFEIFDIERGYVGVFKPGLRNNTILVLDTPNVDEASIIQHEYVHFLMRNHTGFAFPRWFDEGLSEYLSGTKIQRKFFHIGRPQDHRVYELQNFGLLRAEIMLYPAASENLGLLAPMFYAQSWLMVHFLLNRDDRDSTFVEDMRTYMEQISSGIDEIEAFESAFGVSGKRFKRELERYFRSGCCKYFRFRIDALQPNFAPEARRMSRAEISLRLGQTALDWGKIEAAQRWFEIAAEAEETRPWAESGLGSILTLNEEYDAARPRFETAISLAPEDAEIQLDLASYWLIQAEASDSQDAQKKYLAHARSRFVEAWKLDDTKPETYVLYGQTFLLEDSRHDKAIEMLEEAQYLHPSSVEIRLLLAVAYAMADRKDDAITTAELVLAWGHNDIGIAQSANAIILSMSADEPEEIIQMESTEP